MKKYLLLIFMILLPLSLLYSQQRVERYVIGTGGGVSAGTNFILTGTAGQQFAGRTEGVSNRSYSGFWYTYSVLTGVDETTQLPDEYRLYQNYPNPFNPVTKIRYELPEESSVSLRIYNLIGEEIAVLADGAQAPGKYEVTWNAAGYASGFYICRIEAGKYVSVRKLVLLK
jgi:hypothetical protein